MNFCFSLVLYKGKDVFNFNASQVMTIALQSLLYVNMVSNGVLFSRVALQGRGYCSNSKASPNNNEPPKNDKDK
jgi:hypothetical protein